VLLKVIYKYIWKKSFQLDAKSNSDYHYFSLLFLKSFFVTIFTCVCRIAAALASAISRAIKKSLGRDKKFRLTAWELVSNPDGFRYSPIAEFTFFRHLLDRASLRTHGSFLVGFYVSRIRESFRENCRGVAIFLKNRACVRFLFDVNEIKDWNKVQSWKMSDFEMAFRYIEARNKTDIFSISASVQI